MSTTPAAFAASTIAEQSAYESAIGFSQTIGFPDSADHHRFAVCPVGRSDDHRIDVITFAELDNALAAQCAELPHRRLRSLWVINASDTRPGELYETAREGEPEVSRSDQPVSDLTRWCVLRRQEIARRAENLGISAQADNMMG